MGGYEVEVSCAGRLIDIVLLPYSIFELDNCVLDYHSYCDIAFDIHVVLHADKELTVVNHELVIALDEA